MKYALLFAILLSLILIGCTQSEMSTGWSVAENTARLGYDRYKRSNDVVLVKGINGNKNILCMRRGFNVLWGPSAELKSKSGLGFWQYIERNRKIQIYDNVGVAHYGKNKFDMTPEVAMNWKIFQANMEADHVKQTDYVMFEHLLRRKAQINEAASEFKQEEYLYKHRND